MGDVFILLSLRSVCLIVRRVHLPVGVGVSSLYIRPRVLNVVCD